VFVGSTKSRPGDLGRRERVGPQRSGGRGAQRRAIPPGVEFEQRFMERWPSGRRRTPGKCVTPNRVRGFESHPLRQIKRGLSFRPLFIWRCGVCGRTHSGSTKSRSDLGRRERVGPERSGGRGAQRRAIPPSPPLGIWASKGSSRSASIELTVRGVRQEFVRDDLKLHDSLMASVPVVRTDNYHYLLG
jgi:hypothetical protein